MSRLLIVDDEPSICWSLAELAREMGHEALTTASAEEGLRIAGQQNPEAIVLDVRLPGMDGLSAMERFREILGPVPILIVTAHGDLATAVGAVRGGAFDYLLKPFDLKTAERAIRRALTGAGAAPATPGNREAEPERIVGDSPSMQEVFKRIALVSASDVCVHLRGESGTGKELAARAVHRHSRRAEGPFVAIHLAALSPSVVESELFGHARGAFTGAEEARTGLLAQADGGTVFLDEVADIPLALQVKLLRAVEQGEVTPVGSNRPVRADFRVISATHQNLTELVARGDFRHDLYFRLVAFEIEMPPLRQRREDIRPLAEHFLRLLEDKAVAGPASLSPEALARLETYPWYGNVRELRHAVEHATVLARGGTIAPEHLPPAAPSSMIPSAVHADDLADQIRRWTESQLDAPDAAQDLYDRFLRMVEPPFLSAALARHQGQCATAARTLGMHRTTLSKKLREYRIGEG